MASGFSLKLVFFGLILLAVLLEVIGDVILKKWALGGKNVLLMLGLLIYFTGSIFWVISLKYEYLSRAISVFTILNLVLLVAAGVVIFKENLSFTNKIGICLGILSVVLMEI